MTLDLDELERLEREATPGPWHPLPMSIAGGTPGSNDTGADGRLIAAARNALPEMIAEIRKLRLAVDAWASDLRALATDCGQTGDEYPRGAVERELRALRAVAEAAARVDDHETVLGNCDANPCIFCDSLRDMRRALDAWRGVR